jgi:NAD(P)-dependent dehydrogenase (short-subunit alcohol dehydrogenase family)
VQTILITGCSSGIGLRSAVTLARHGFRVFATMRDLGKRSPLDAALAEAGAAVELLQLDVTSAASIQAAVDEAMARGGHIDALINNAGFGIGGFVEDMTIDDYRRQFETNFFGLVAVTKAVLPHMRRRRSGRIVNLSSLNGRVGIGVQSAYTASKFAVEAFSESLAFEASFFNVRVIVIEPGMFKTEILRGNRQMARRASDPESPYFALMPLLEAKLKTAADRLAGDPQKVADVILRVLRVRRPRLRYMVGVHARLLEVAHRFGGFALYSAVLRTALGIRRREVVALLETAPATLLEENAAAHRLAGG